MTRLSLRSRFVRPYVKYVVARQFSEKKAIRGQRRAFDRTSFFVPRIRGAETRTEFIDGTKVCWVDACENTTNRLVVYLHGGAYCLGSPRSHGRFAQQLSKASQAQVLLVDYRLAPEYPFPAALKDSLGVYRSLLGRSDVSAESLVLGGDSAGGGLALATAIALRDGNQPLPNALFCLSPWTDLTLGGGSIKSNARADFVLSENWLRSMAERYVPDAADRNLPLVSPLMAGLAGLPPLFIQVATSEILLDDSLRLAERARRAGVEVELELWPDMWHVWQLLASLVPESMRALQQLGRFIQRVTANALITTQNSATIDASVHDTTTGPVD